MTAYNFFVSRPKLTICSFNRGRVCSWSNAFLIFVVWICSGDICDQSRMLWKSRHILDVFALPNFVGAGPKSHTLVITSASRQITWKSFVKLSHTSPKVKGTHMVNFKPHFKWSPLKFFGDPCPRLGSVLAHLGQSLVRVKISGASAPLKNIHLGGSTWAHIDFWLVDQSSTNFSSSRGWNVVDQVLFRFLTCRSVPEIFAIKVESCQKSRRILNNFLSSQIL